MWIWSNEVSKDNRVLKSTTEAGTLFQTCCITHTVWKLKPWFCSLKGVVAYAIRKLISRDDFDRPVRESERARCPSWHWLLRTGCALAAQPVRSQPSSLREADTQSLIAMPPTPQSPSRCIRCHHRRRRLRRWRRLLYLGGKNMQDGPKKQLDNLSLPSTSELFSHQCFKPNELFNTSYTAIAGIQHTLNVGLQPV